MNRARGWCKNYYNDRCKKQNIRIREQVLEAEVEERGMDSMVLVPPPGVLLEASQQMEKWIDMEMQSKKA